MGQKMNPNGLRVGIIKDWNSKWYADSKHFADYLVEDHKIREYVKKKLYASGISKVEIERTAIVCPTICGYIVEALDHVFNTSFFPLSFIASTRTFKGHSGDKTTTTK
jgi:hypothetical protein